MSARPELDTSYFDDTKTWHERREAWLTGNQATRFWAANVQDFQRRLSAASHGAKAVVNIGAYALSQLVKGERYQNTYQRAAQTPATDVTIGGRPPPVVEEKRKEVDRLFGLNPPENYFFAAASMEGTGVRYYGEYCMVLADCPADDTQIVDRDSYELLSQPFDQPALVNRVLSCIRGTWGSDLVDMAAMKIRDTLSRTERITTSMLQARALLEGEEFIEVHLHLPPTATTDAGFGIADVKEVRQDAREVAAAERISNLFITSHPVRIADLLFILRREALERAFSYQGVASRVVREERTA